MSESTIIWKFLSREFPDNHSVVFLHVCGNIRSQQNAMDKALKICLPIFTPPMTEQYVKTVIKGFLDMKKKQYLRGEIRVNPIYNS
jgi:hypothetical protein